MRDDLDVMGAVILNHITAILYVGRWFAGKGLTEGVEACIKYFSPYIKWREVAIETEYQALMLAEGNEEMGLWGAKPEVPLRMGKTQNR